MIVQIDSLLPCKQKKKKNMCDLDKFWKWKKKVTEFSRFLFYKKFSTQNRSIACRDAFWCKSCQYPTLEIIHSIAGQPTREHIGNIDDSLLLSSIASMMHQFYIDHRKHWWIFDVTLMFRPCFPCFFAFKPAMFHLLNINNSSIKHRWIINERTMNRGRGGIN